MDTTATHPTGSPKLIAALLLCLGFCYGVAALGGMFTASSVQGWYLTIQKPDWTPPGSVIGSVWTVLYGMMAIAAWIAWRETGIKGPPRWVVAFSVQLALNLAWSVIFFGLQSPGWALIELVALWIAISVTMKLMWNVRPLAGALLIPYLGWVTFAGYLNFTIWRMNS